MPRISVQPVILCGGSGTRLWPLSRAEFPKQFLSLLGKESLFQLAALRLAKMESETCAVASPLIVGNEEHRLMTLDQLRETGLEPRGILLEPAGRNTAPALTLAALAAREDGSDPVMAVSPADHMVLDIPAFVDTLREAAAAAEKGAIVTLGIVPDRPETGYGYIRAGKGQDRGQVKAFVEKPDAETARRYIDEGGYFWNSGIFVLKASVWLAALGKFRPDIARAMEKAWKSRQKDAAFIRPERTEFEVVPAESIDYAVMEKCPGSGFDIQVVPLAAGWSDLGSWDAAWQSATKDGDGNAHIGDVMLRDSRNVFVHASSRLVSVVGLSNVVVVETPDAVLVTSRTHSQDVRKIAANPSTERRAENAQRRKTRRPVELADCID